MKWLLVCLTTFTSGIWAADSWPLSTDDTAAVVAVEQGRPLLKRLSMPVRLPQLVAVRCAGGSAPRGWVQGRSTPTNWRFQGGSLDSPGGKLTLRFTNADPPLELQSIWRARPGRGPVEHWLNHRK
jgi:hypothetical protein